MALRRCSALLFVICTGSMPASLRTAHGRKSVNIIIPRLSELKYPRLS